MKRAISLIGVLIFVGGCGSAPSGTSPSPLVTAATLSISAFTVTVQPGASSGIFNDRATLHLTETSGKVGLTLNTFTFTFLPGGGGAIVQVSGHVAAGGSLDPAGVVITGAPTTGQLTVVITFVDDQGHTGVATATADIVTP